MGNPRLACAHWVHMWTMGRHRLTTAWFQRKWTQQHIMSSRKVPPKSFKKCRNQVPQHVGRYPAQGVSIAFILRTLVFRMKHKALWWCRSQDSRMTGVLQYLSFFADKDSVGLRFMFQTSLPPLVITCHPAWMSFHVELESWTTAVADFILEHRCRPRRRWNVTTWSVNCGVALGLCGTKPMRLCAWIGGCGR